MGGKDCSVETGTNLSPKVNLVLRVSVSLGSITVFPGIRANPASFSFLLSPRKFLLSLGLWGSESSGCFDWEKHITIAAKRRQIGPTLCDRHSSFRKASSQTVTYTSVQVKQTTDKENHIHITECHQAEWHCS